MTDDDIQAIYSAGLGVSHVAALKAVFAAGYAAHAGTALGNGADPSSTASAPTAFSIPKLPNGKDHH